MKISEKLYELRKQHGMTQKEFSDKTGVSQSAIAYYEQGSREPKVSQLKKIALSFDIPIMELIECDFG